VALSWESVPTGESADRKVWRRLRANQLPAPANTVLPG
jgi:hypothetical protein